MDNPSQHDNRLAIIGGGPSGLVTLKFALEQLEGWEIVCFEKQDAFRGAWGKTHPHFVSTSTKYTTQFACFSNFTAELGANPTEAEEFFREHQFGDYLEEFVRKFQLARCVRLETEVVSLKHNCVSPGHDEWIVRARNLQNADISEESFSHVIICSGLTRRVEFVPCAVASHDDLNNLDDISGKRVVVFGGGESAVEVAQRLCPPRGDNKVFLSLRSGIRVSPRYHPIKNIPSDFLRSRLMMSVHEDLRNWLGEAFVDFRIRFADLLAYLFPSRHHNENRPIKSIRSEKARWNLRISRRAEGRLFNMFHNKSDDFLLSLAEKRLSLLGPAVDHRCARYFDFERNETILVSPDVLIKAIGLTSNLEQLTDRTVELRDFYWGCLHVSFPTLFCVGYARPIIGNIPTISELQARYVIGMIAGRFARPPDLHLLHEREQQSMQSRYPTIDLNQIYPVDMIPYCDQLAAAMKIYPSSAQFQSVRHWLSFWLSPATTGQYAQTDGWNSTPAPIYVPWPIITLLLLVKLVDLPYRFWKAITRRANLPTA